MSNGELTGVIMAHWAVNSERIFSPGKARVAKSVRAESTFSPVLKL